MVAQLTAVDLFAGSGGSSLGAKQAGVKVLWAANHWSTAVLTHAMNHPDVKHVCQDLRQANWREVPDHHVALMSPCCQGHTRARGRDRVHHDSSRATAWACVDAVEVKQPPFLVVENVPEFRNWRHFGRWWDCLAEDYHLTANILDAADFAVPQNRVRLFIVGVHKRVAPVPLPIAARRLPHHTAASTILDWDAPGWDLVERSNRAANTVARVRQGRQQFGKSPFLVAYYGSSRGGRSLDRPLGTVTTRDRYALVDGKWMRMLTPNEYRRAMAFPEGYVLPKAKKHAIKMLGNAVVPPVMAHVLRQIRQVARTCRLVA